MLMDKGTDISISDDILNYYLLNDKHAFGKLKNKVFKKLGFNKSNIDLLKRELTLLTIKNDTTKCDTLLGAILVYKQQEH